MAALQPEVSALISCAVQFCAERERRRHAASASDGSAATTAVRSSRAWDMFFPGGGRAEGRWSLARSFCAAEKWREKDKEREREREREREKGSERVGERERRGKERRMERGEMNRHKARCASTANKCCH